MKILAGRLYKLKEEEQRKKKKNWVVKKKILAGAVKFGHMYFILITW